MMNQGSRPKTGFSAAISYQSFTFFQVAKILSSLATQIQTVAVGAQVYALTHQPMDLGVIGLSQFLPFLLLVLPAGQAADRYDRRALLMGCFALELICGAALWWFTVAGLASPLPVFAVMVLFGVARAFSSPAASALMPNLVPPELFSTAVGISSSSWQLSVIAGPALGGLLYAFGGPAIAYLTVAALMVVAVFCMQWVKSPSQSVSHDSTGMKGMMDGLSFVRSRPVIFGAISLDLFAVLFGGATALLPAYAMDVLHVGPAGLGWLRASPGIGASLVAMGLTARPIERRVGHAMFLGVLVFAVATVLFSVSVNFWWSLFLLAVLGAADMVSVFVRQMMVQIETPDHMRGRVGAVSSMFIGASNELGEFESGVTAAWLGLVPSVALGGIATLVVVAVWAMGFPALRNMDRFADMKRDDAGC